jgi:hypothetical protein
LSLRFAGFGFLCLLSIAKAQSGKPFPPYISCAIFDENPVKRTDLVYIILLLFPLRNQDIAVLRPLVLLVPSDWSMLMGDDMLIPVVNEESNSLFLSESINSWK